MEDDLDADDLGFDDGGAPGEGDGAPVEGDTLRQDIEESIAKQRIEKGHPEPYRGLQGRNDTAPGGRYDGMETYATEAARNGTTIQAAIKDYVSVEKALRKDFASGGEYLCNRMGVDPRRLQSALNARYSGPQGQQRAAGMAQQMQYTQAHSVKQLLYGGDLGLEAPPIRRPY